MNDITIRVDNSSDWAEVQRGNEIVRRCHADDELIDTLLSLLEEAGATVEWTTVTGKRV